MVSCLNDAKLKEPLKKLSRDFRNIKENAHSVDWCPPNKHCWEGKHVSATFPPLQALKNMFQELINLLVQTDRDDKSAKQVNSGFLIILEMRCHTSVWKLFYKKWHKELDLFSGWDYLLVCQLYVNFSRVLILGTLREI